MADDHSFQVESAKATATIAFTDGHVIVSLANAQGIGKLEIRKSSEQEPAPVDIVLPFQHLESLRVETGDWSLETGVNSSGDILQVFGTQKGKAGGELDPDHPNFIRIERNAGGFAVKIPAALWAADAYSVSWVDLFR